MPLFPSRLSTAAIATTTSVATLLALTLWITGPVHFRDALLAFASHILGISILAALVTLPFKRGGLALSITCGVSVAIAGFLVVLRHAFSHI